MVTELFAAGPPPWNEVQGQVCMKYASVTRARRAVGPWLGRLLDRMLSTLPADSPLIDVRWWPHLEPGQVPGVPGWHYDAFNDPARGVEDTHRLYVAGANCRTEFRGGYFVPEEMVVAYDHTDEHRISPAGAAGPRLLVRVSKTSIRAGNRFYNTAHIHPTPYLEAEK